MAIEHGHRQVLENKRLLNRDLSVQKPSTAKYAFHCIAANNYKSMQPAGDIEK